MKIRLPLLLLTLLFPSLTKADYVSVVYTGWVNPANNFNVGISNIVVGGLLYNRLFFSRPNANVLAAKCDVASVKYRNANSRFWLMIPNVSVAQGMTFTHPNTTMAEVTNVPVPPGYTLWASDELLTVDTQLPNIACPNLGSQVQVDRPNNFFGGILYRLQNPIAGAYNIRLPIYAGVHTVYYPGIARPPASSFNNEIANLLLSAGPEYINLRATVQAECSLSSGGSDININHGPIMLQQGVTAYPSNDYTLGLNCTSPASASFP